ncbi:MAG: two-component regulator propeller domain-containing protein, partial [Bacteroidales bacterium]
MVRQTTLWLWVMLNCQTIMGIENETIVTNDYSYYDGLTTNIVNGTFKDSRGFLWICSINGLLRYDGYHFKKINTKDKILSCEVLNITEDINGNLWVATAKRGVIYYNIHNEEIFPLSIGINFSFNINRILVFKQKVWLATDSGLIFFELEKAFERNRQYPSKVILPEPSNPSDQRNRITCLYVYADSINLWIGANGGLFVLNTTNSMLKGFLTHPQNAIRTMVPLHDKLLIGSWDGGVFLVNPYTLTLT